MLSLLVCVCARVRARALCVVFLMISGDLLSFTGGGGSSYYAVGTGHKRGRGRAEEPADGLCVWPFPAGRSGTEVRVGAGPAMPLYPHFSREVCWK